MNTSHKIYSLKKRAINGFAYLMAREALMKVIAIAGQLALVRILTPEIFGSFAIITFIIAFADLFTDLGLSMIIIQKKVSPNQNDLSTIFFLRIFQSGIVIAIIVMVSPYIHLLYSQIGSLELTVAKVVSLIIMVKALRSVQLSLLERKLAYKVLSGIDLAGIAIYYAIALVLAFFGYGIWSFAWATLLKEVIETIITYFYSSWRPKIYFNLSSIKTLIITGVFYQMSFVTGFVHRATIPLVAGIFSSNYNVGLLDWSSNVASIPRTLTENVGRVSFASFSRIQNDKKIIEETIIKVIKILGLFSIFFILVTLSFGHEIVIYFLTEKWLPALPALYYFIGATFFLNGTAIMGNIILAMGKTKLMFFSSIGFIVLEYVLSLLFLNSMGFSGIALANLVGIIVMFVYLCIILRILNINIKLVGYFTKAFAIFLAILFLNFYLNMIFGNSFIILFVKILLSLAFYLSLNILFLPEAFF